MLSYYLVFQIILLKSGQLIFVLKFLLIYVTCAVFLFFLFIDMEKKLLVHEREKFGRGRL